MRADDISLQVDKAQKEYWDSRWNHKSLPPPADPRDARWNNYFVREVDRFVRSVIAGMLSPPIRILEIGCANSRWLPYFAREYDLEVWGLDYSPTGCARARD